MGIFNKYNGKSFLRRTTPCLFISIGITLSGWAIAQDQSCPNYQRPYANYCISKRLSTYIDCLQTQGADKTKLETAALKLGTPRIASTTFEKELESLIYRTLSEKQIHACAPVLQDVSQPHKQLYLQQNLASYNVPFSAASQSTMWAYAKKIFTQRQQAQLAEHTHDTEFGIVTKSAPLPNKDLANAAAPFPQPAAVSSAAPIRILPVTEIPVEISNPTETPSNTIIPTETTTHHSAKKHAKKASRQHHETRIAQDEKLSNVPVSQDTTTAKETKPLASAPTSPPIDAYKVELAADAQVKLPGVAGELRLWIGVPTNHPNFPESMVTAIGTLPPLGKTAKIEPFSVGFEFEPKNSVCLKIDPTGSEVRFKLKPIKEGTFDVSANVSLFDSMDCSGTPIPKATTALQVHVIADASVDWQDHIKQLKTIAWDKSIHFFGALVALILSALFFLIRGTLKKWIGFNNHQS